MNDRDMTPGTENDPDADNTDTINEDTDAGADETSSGHDDSL